MQDLDFDELDKAVNSLMPKVPERDTSIPPRPIATTVQPVAAPAPLPVSNPVTSTVTPIYAPAEKTVDRPSTGRFMDVVHPSSDMRTTTPAVPERAAPTVFTPSMQPVQPYVAPNPVVAPPAPAEAVDNWAGLPNYSSPAPSVPESPFLSDAKVEKRPLGSFSDASIAPEQPVDSTTPDDVQKTTYDTTLPAELESSVLGVESDSSTHADDINIAQNPLSHTMDASEMSAEYDEKASSPDSKLNSVYDTSSYHQAVTKKPKKKSGWMWVLWIFLLLVIGAGAGVAFYFWIMPMIPGFTLPDIKLPF